MGKKSAAIEKCISGKGPGTFAYYFPQFDYAGLLTTHGDTDFVITKPHNFYCNSGSDRGHWIMCVIVFVYIDVKRKLEINGYRFQEGRSDRKSNKNCGNYCNHLLACI